MFIFPVLPDLFIPLYTFIHHLNLYEYNLQYEPYEQAHWLFDAYNLTVNNLLNRYYFQNSFWKWSNIDTELIANISAKCYSIGYLFDHDSSLSSHSPLETIYSILTVNTSCFHNEYSVSKRLPVLLLPVLQKSNEIHQVC